MLGGWTGTVLRVDLTSGKIGKEPLNEQWAREFVGGRGVAARYLYEEGDPQVDPLSPGNPLIFATGPLTGTNTSTSSRYMVVTKGPLTGAMTTSSASPLPKGRGMPVWSSVSTPFSYSSIAAAIVAPSETGVPDASVAAIGPAGENKVLYAAIVNEKFRAAGRSGVGAVMGAKKLKAIVVRGTGAVSVARPQEMLQAQWAMKAELAAAPLTAEGLPAYGTLSLMNVINEHGALPTNNYLEAQFEGAEHISGEELAETRLATNKACFGCTIACGRVSRVSDEGVGRYTMKTSPRNWKHATEGPEYENAWSLGADCGIDDLDAILKSNTLCNDLGMDPISLGATIAAAMELYEKGVLTDDQTGMPLPFGSGEALVALTEAAALRRGFGNELAEGSKRMCEKFGEPDAFMGVKGQEFPAYDPRAIQGMGLGYATSNRGACHLRAYTVAAEVLDAEPMDPRATDGKADLVMAFQNVSTAVDATGLCIFLTFGTTLESIRPILVAATGIELDDDQMVQVGERIWNLERVWNNRAGLTAADDTLPKRMLEQAIPAGPAAGEVNKLGEMLPEYYRVRGWSEQGEPLPEKLAELGLA
jgi:aldehyde:ferredoxin oxidoreductase